MSRLGCADEAMSGKGVMGSTASLQVLMPRPNAQGVLGQQRGSVAAPPTLLATGK